MIAWSFSRLQDAKCLRRFYHKNIIKDVKVVPNAAMERGKKLHNKLELRTKVVVYNGVEHRAVDPEIAHVDPIIKHVVGTHEMVLAERQLAFNRAYEPCDWFAKETWMRAILDLIGMQGDTATVLDWKTGRINVDMAQCELFAVATMLKWPQINKVLTTLVFIDHKWSAPVMTFERPYLQNLLHGFEEQAERIQIAEERDEWPATPNDKCKWCPCTPDMCEYSKS